MDTLSPMYTQTPVSKRHKVPSPEEKQAKHLITNLIYAKAISPRTLFRIQGSSKVPACDEREVSNPHSSTASKFDTTPTMQGPVKTIDGSKYQDSNVYQLEDPLGSDVKQVEPSTTQALHLEFEFSLFTGGVQRQPSTEESKTIMATFPTCHRLLFCPPFMVIKCTTLPEKPWPLTIAGIPACFTEEYDYLPMDFGICAHGGRMEVSSPPVLWKTPSQEIFREIVSIYESKHKTRISSIGWLGMRFLVKLREINDDTKFLPALIGNILVTYTVLEDTKHRKAALRAKLPANEICDDTNYSGALRPGVMLSCGDTGPELLTTSGIPLVDKNGKRFVSVASPGFPLGCEAVFHPNSQGQHIGDIKNIVLDTDISLLSLNPGISYASEPFESALGSGPHLRGLLGPSELAIGTALSMNSAFSGICQGICTMLDYVAIPSDEPTTPMKWLNITWMYLGNGAEEPADGSCGSVIWDDNGNAVAFFRFAHTKGFSLASSVLPLIELGMSLEEII